MRNLAFSFLAAALVCGFAPGARAATVQMVSYVSFANPLITSKSSDLGISWVHALPNDIITMNTAGTVTIAGNGRVKLQNGYPGIINIDDMHGQGVNFLPMNYQYSQNVGSMTAICSLNGVDEADCDKFLPLTGFNEKLLHIGMHMKVLNELNAREKFPSSFDMSVVFQ